MLSSDQNVETISQLVEVVRHYIGLQSEYVKLDVIEKVVRLLTVMAIVAMFALLLIIMMIYFSFAAAYTLEPLMGMVGAFSVVGSFYLLVLILFVLFRKQLVEKPLVRFLANLLMSN